MLKKNPSSFPLSLRVISLLLVQAFLLQDVLFAAPDLKPGEFRLFDRPAVNLKIPASVATVGDRWLASTTHPSRPKTVFLIEDAHTNASGQMNASKVVESLIRDEKVKFVFLEAGTGNDSLSFLRNAATPEKRKAVAAKYLREGVLSGSEYLDLTSDLEFRLWGVEKKELYWQALRAYKKVAEGREKFQGYLSRIETAVRALKPRIFNPALQEFDQKTEAFLKEELTLTDYFEVLAREAGKRGIELRYYPHLEALQKLEQMERGIDFTRANEEQLAAVSTLSKEDLEAIDHIKEDSHSPFKLSSTDHKTARAFYALLEEKINSQRQDPPVIYPELFKYFAYLKESEKINPKAVLLEQKLLENAVFETLMRTDDERALHQASLALRLLRGLLNLSLSPEEYRLYKEDPRAFSPAFITGFLNKKIMELKELYERATFLEEGYEDYVKNAEAFYEITLDRDRAMVGNLLEKMDTEQETSVVLITGGYHTPNLKALFRKNNLSYIVITPQIFGETNRARYEKLLLSQLDAVKTAAGSPQMTARPGMAALLPAAEVWPRMELVQSGLAVVGARLVRRDESGSFQKMARRGIRGRETGVRKHKESAVLNRIQAKQRAERRRQTGDEPFPADITGARAAISPSPAQAPDSSMKGARLALGETTTPTARHTDATGETPVRVDKDERWADETPAQPAGEEGLAASSSKPSAEGARLTRATDESRRWSIGSNPSAAFKKIHADSGTIRKLIKEKYPKARVSSRSTGLVFRLDEKESITSWELSLYNNGFVSMYYFHNGQPSGMGAFRDWRINFTPDNRIRVNANGQRSSSEVDQLKFKTSPLQSIRIEEGEIILEVTEAAARWLLQDKVGPVKIAVAPAKAPVGARLPSTRATQSRLLRMSRPKPVERARLPEESFDLDKTGGFFAGLKDPDKSFAILVVVSLHQYPKLLISYDMMRILGSTPQEIQAWRETVLTVERDFQIAVLKKIGSADTLKAILRYIEQNPPPIESRRLVRFIKNRLREVERQAPPTDEESRIQSAIEALDSITNHAFARHHIKNYDDLLADIRKHLEASDIREAQKAIDRAKKELDKTKLVQSGYRMVFAPLMHVKQRLNGSFAAGARAAINAPAPEASAGDFVAGARFSHVTEMILVLAVVSFFLTLFLVQQWMIRQIEKHVRRADDAIHSRNWTLAEAELKAAEKWVRIGDRLLIIDPNQISNLVDFERIDHLWKFLAERRGTPPKVGAETRGARAAVNPPAGQKFLLFTASLTVLRSLLFLGLRFYITFFHEHFMSQPFIVRWSEQTGSWILALWVVTSVAIVIRNQNSIGKSTASRGARLATPAASNGARLAIRVDELEDSGLRTDLEHCGIKFIYSTDESNSRISGRGALVRTVHTTKELIALRVRSDLWPAFLKLLESAVRYGGVEAVYIDPSASVEAHSFDYIGHPGIQSADLSIIDRTLDFRNPSAGDLKPQVLLVLPQSSPSLKWKLIRGGYAVFEAAADPSSDEPAGPVSYDLLDVVITDHKPTASKAGSGEGFRFLLSPGSTDEETIAAIARVRQETPLRFVRSGEFDPPIVDFKQKVEIGGTVYFNIHFNRRLTAGEMKRLQVRIYAGFNAWDGWIEFSQVTLVNRHGNGSYRFRAELPNHAKEYKIKVSLDGGETWHWFPSESNVHLVPPTRNWTGARLSARGRDRSEPETSSRVSPLLEGASPVKFESLPVPSVEAKAPAVKKNRGYPLGGVDVHGVAFPLTPAGARAAINPPADQKFLLFTASLTVLRSLLFLGLRFYITFFHEHFMSQPLIVRWSEQMGSWILALWVVTSVAIVIRNQNSIGKSTASHDVSAPPHRSRTGARLSARHRESEPKTFFRVSPLLEGASPVKFESLPAPSVEAKAPAAKNPKGHPLGGVDVHGVAFPLTREGARLSSETQAQARLAREALVGSSSFLRKLNTPITVEVSETLSLSRGVKVPAKFSIAPKNWPSSIDKLQLDWRTSRPKNGGTLVSYRVEGAGVIGITFDKKGGFAGYSSLSQIDNQSFDLEEADSLIMGWLGSLPANREELNAVGEFLKRTGSDDYFSRSAGNLAKRLKTRSATFADLEVARMWLRAYREESAGDFVAGARLAEAETPEERLSKLMRTLGDLAEIHKAQHVLDALKEVRRDWTTLTPAKAAEILGRTIMQGPRTFYLSSGVLQIVTDLTDLVVAQPTVVSSQAQVWPGASAITSVPGARLTASVPQETSAAVQEAVVVLKALVSNEGVSLADLAEMTKKKIEGLETRDKIAVMFKLTAGLTGATRLSIEEAERLTRVIAAVQASIVADRASLLAANPRTGSTSSRPSAPPSGARLISLDFEASPEFRVPSSAKLIENESPAARGSSVIPILFEEEVSTFFVGVARADVIPSSSVPPRMALGETIFEVSKTGTQVVAQAESLNLKVAFDLAGRNFEENPVRGASETLLRSQDLGLLLKLTNGAVNQKLSSVPEGTASAVIVDIDLGMIPRGSAETNYLKYLVAELKAIRQSDVKVFFRLMGDAALKAETLELSEAQGVFINDTPPSDLKDAVKVILTTPSTGFHADHRNIPVQPLSEGDVPAIQALVRLAIKAGRLDPNAIPSSFLDAWTSLSAERPDTQTVMDILLGKANPQMAWRFALRPVARVAVNEAVRFFDLMRRMLGQSA